MVEFYTPGVQHHCEFQEAENGCCGYLYYEYEEGLSAVMIAGKMEGVAFYGKSFWG